MRKAEEIINYILSQTQNGVVKIECADNSYWTFYSKLQLNLQDSTTNLFYECCDKYLKVAKKFYEQDKQYFDLTDAGFEEKLMFDLLQNLTAYDKNTLVEYVILRTKMLLNEDILTPNTLTIGEFNGNLINLNVIKNHSNIESPFSFCVNFTGKDGECFYVPRVGFGVAENKLKVMFVQARKEKQTNKISKSLDRLFRKVNKGVDETRDIYQVSPNAVVAFSLFATYMHGLGFNGANVEMFFPERYETNKLAGYRKNSSRLVAKEFLEKHNRNQFNMTNKLMNLCARFAYHFNADCDFDMVKEQIVLDWTNISQNEDNLIYDIVNSLYPLYSEKSC